VKNRFKRFFGWIFKRPENPFRINRAGDEPMVTPIYTGRSNGAETSLLNDAQLSPAKRPAEPEEKTLTWIGVKPVRFGKK
jgi:hypothetical protein